jgi:branched-chain amino acid transport system permease protein
MLKNWKSIKILMIIASVLLLIAVPFLGFNSYIMRIFILIGIYTILATSLNLLTGFTGQVSLGHAAFYGIGAYSSALLAMKLGMPFLLSSFLGAIIAAFFGFILGLPTLRLNGSYLSIVTLGFCEITRLIELNWMSVTRGPMGITGIPSPVIFGIKIDTDRGYFYLIAVFTIITVFLIKNIIKSRTGRAMIAIREDELAAEAMGVNILKYKVMAFIVSAFFAGLAGAFYAHYVSFIDPQSFTFDESTQILSMVILGGMGSLTGSFLGTIMLVSIPELLRDFAQYRMLIYGGVLVFMIVMRPDGIIGIFNDIASKLKKLKAGSKKVSIGR